MAVTNDFTSSALDLNDKVTMSQPTALVWGPDGRLYVTEVDGDVRVLDVAFGDPDPSDGDPAAKFHVTAAETVGLVKSIPNYDDDGGPAGTNIRQVTGIDVTAQYDANGDPVIIDGKPATVMYVTSSDSRIGAGGSGEDADLDTNSGVITRIVQTEDGWDATDIVRGLSRSEENHATNGLEVIQELDGAGKLVSERIIVASGGNANTGAPSNNFAGQQEQPLSGAILEVDLTEILGMEVSVGAGGRKYVYDLPTLDDPTRPNADDGGDDPFGGNDGLNSAKLVEGPVRIYSAGYRNAYDVEVSDDGRVWTYDNGANDSWGGRPAGEDQDGDKDSTEAETGTPPGYVATNLFVNDNAEIFGNFNPQNWDQLHEVTRSDDLNGRSLSAGQGGATVYDWDHPDYAQPLQLVYGGHPNPTRAEGARAGIVYSPKDGLEDALLMVSNAPKGDGTTSDFIEVVAWLSSIGYSGSFIAQNVVAVNPGVTYSDQFVAGYSVPTAPGAYSLVEDANGPIGLPADIDDIVHALNPVEGNYLEAGYTDGAIDTGKGSINGLTEYTSTILDQGGVKMSGALIAASLNQGQFYVIGRDANGVVQTDTDGNRTIADDRTFLDAAGGPLGLASIGDDLVPHGGQAAFQGTIWSAVFQQNGPIIEVFQPGNPDTNPLVPVYAGQEPSDPTDNDLDGIDHVNDPFEFSAQNGIPLEAGERIVLNFSKVDGGAVDAFAGTLGDTGLMGAALDGTTPNRDAFTGTFDDDGDGTPDDGVGDGFPVASQRSGLFDNAGNLILGGNAPILQVKSVREGTAIGGANTLQDGMHTGVRLGDDVERMVAEVDVFNWVADQPGEGRVTGLVFGDGTQSNFVRLVFGDVAGDGGLGLQVGIETGDQWQPLATVTDDAAFASALTGAGAEGRIVTLQLEISDIGGDYEIAARYRLDGQDGYAEIPLDAQVPAGVLRDVLDGNHTISDGSGTAPSGAAVGIVAERGDAQSFTSVDFDAIRVEAFGNEIAASDADAVANAAGTPGRDTVVYDGTDTDLGPLPGDVEDFDGSASDADFALVANDLDNDIQVGSGANAISTGAGADTVRGTLADLAGDTVTDFSREDRLVIEGVTAADMAGATYAQDGGAAITVNGTTFTLGGPDFAPGEFEPANGAAYLDFADTADGVEVTSRAPLSPVVAINAGGAGGESFSGTLRDTALTFVGDGGGTSDGPGWTATGANKAYTNGDAAALDFPGTDLDDVLESERSNANEFGYSIDVPNGTYLVDFLFAEIYHGLVTNGSGAGAREMDVEVEGTLVYDDLDVAAEAGGAGELLVKTHEVTVTDGAIDIDISAVTDQGKLSGLVVWSVGGGFVPVDAVAPVVESIALENPQNVQDGTRTATVVVTDETGFADGAFDGLSGSVLQVGGIVPDAVSYEGAALSDGGKTATLTFEITGEGNAWVDGTAGTLSLAAGAFDDAAGNGSAAASAGFVIQSNLGALERGAVVRAINIGTTKSDVGDLDGDDDAAYGGAIAADTLIVDAFGNPVAFEADDDAYHTSPKPNQDANVDGKSGTTGSNAGGIDLDGSAYHTYRDSEAGSWTSTFDGFANGTYVVELHFAELFASSQAQSRVGDFAVNGTVLADDYDAFAVAGGADLPSVVRQAVTVTDGTIQVLVDDASNGQPGYAAIVVYDAVDPDGGASLSVGDAVAAEGGTAEIEVTRAGDLSEEVSVDVEVVLDGTADATDVGALSAGTVTFAPGETSKTLTLAIADDAELEGAETLSVQLSNATGDSTIAGGTGTVTIAASDSDLAAPVGGTIFELDFEGPGGEAIGAGGFDGALGTDPSVIDEATSEVTGGKLVVETTEGDINDGPDNGSDNDFTKEVDLSDAALTEVFLTTRFDNPFTEALLAAQDIDDGVVPNFVQQGIVLGTGTQVAGEMVKLVWGGVAGTTGIQMWSKGASGDTGLSQSATLTQMIGAGASLFDVASVELTLEIDKAAGTFATWVTLYDELGDVLGGTRPTPTPGFHTTPPVTPPEGNVVLANVADASAPTHVGVHSSDNSNPANSFGSFDATWDFLRLSSPQFTGGAPADAAGGAAVPGGDFSDDRLAPTDLGTLASGETEIVATQQGDAAPGGRDRDYFTFEVAEGQELSAIVLEGWTTEETGLPQGFIGLHDGPIMPADPVTYDGAGQMLGGYVYNGGDVANPGAAQDGNLLVPLGDGNEQGVTFRDGAGFDGPLAAGTYTIWLNQGGASSTARLKLVTEPVEIAVSIADAAPVEEGDGASLAFALTATKGFTGAMDVSFDVGGTPSVQTVEFAGGAGVLNVPAPNDDVDDGDTVVTVALTGAASAATASAIVIDAAAATAAGTVTEDDAAGPPVLPKGELVFAINAGGGEVTTTDGTVFAASDASEWTFVSGFGGDNSVDYTGDGVDDADDEVYETEYYGAPVTFTRGGLEPGDYVLTLKFAEIFATATGARIFDVAVNGQAEVIDDLDLVAVAGKDVAYDVDLPVTVGADGVLTVALSPSADNAKISAIALHAVPADPSAATVSVADVTVSEAESVAEVTFTREGNTDTDMTIAYSTADGTAAAGEDYAAASGTVTILAGEATATIQVALTEDAAEEGDETFTVAIDSAVADGATVTIEAPQATVTISDDDAPDPNDIDGDGIANGDDPFAYDGENGLGNVVAEGVTFRQDFDVDGGDPFADGGFTGISVNPAIDPVGASAADPYGDRTTEDGTSIAGGAFSVTSSEEDRFGTGDNQTTNWIRDNYQAGADVSGVDAFSIVAEAANPFAGGAPAQYAAFGITIGAGGVDDYVKLVFGGNGNPPALRVEIAHEDSYQGGSQSIALSSLGAAAPTAAEIATVRFRLDVMGNQPVGDAPAAPQLTGTVTFLDASGAEIGEIETGAKTVTGSLLAAMQGKNPLTDGDGGVAYGIAITDYGSAGNTFTAAYDFVEIAGPAAVNDAPTAVTLTPATLALPEDVDASAGSMKLADIAVTDDALGANALAVTGADAALFAIVQGATGPELHLAAGAALDFEAAPTLDVTVEVDDAAVGSSPDASAAFALTVTDVNEAPTLTVTPLITELSEAADTAAPIPVATVVVADDALGANALSLVGSDADLFELVDVPGGAELRLVADAVLDFETKPALDVSVVLDDPAIGAGAEATVPVALVLTDAEERVETADAPGDLPSSGGGTDERDVVAYTGDAPVGTPAAPYALPDGFEDFDGAAATGTLAVKGNAADNVITVGMGADDTVDLTDGGADTVAGTASALDGTVIEGFGADDEIVVAGGGEVVSVTNGSTLIGVDTDQDGVADSTITLAETIDPARVASETQDGDLVITIAADDPPEVAAPVGDRTFPEDAPIDFAIPAGTFADDGGEGALTLSAALEDGSALPAWLSFDPATGAFSGTPGQAEVDAGALSITLTATDANGGQASDTFALSVANENDAPVANPDSGTAFQGFSARFSPSDLLSNDTDEDRDTLTLDGVSNPSVGTVAIIGGDAVFTPPAAFSATASFDYTVSDGNGGSATGTVTVEVEGGAPVQVVDVPIAEDRLSGYSNQDAAPGSAEVAPDGSSIAIGGNSWKALDLEQPVEIVEGSKLRFTFDSTDLSEINAIGLETNDTLSGGGAQLFFAVGGSQIGGGFKALTEALDPPYAAGEGPRTYEVDLTPYAGESYTRMIFVNDADQQSGNGTFSNVQFVRPVAQNAAPVAVDDAFTVQAGATLTLLPEAITNNDTDAEDDALTIVSVGAATGGTVEIDADTGLVVFTPAPGATGPASFEYTVSDGNGGTDTGTVAVTIGGGDAETPVTVADADLSSYDRQDRAPGAYEVRDGGAELALTGNTWKALDLPGEGYAITEDTVLRFTFDSADLGEINAIGLDVDRTLANEDVAPQIFFGLGGTDVATGRFKRITEVVEPLYEEGSGPRTYEIDLGAYAGQTYANLVFVNDADSQSGTSVFRDLRFVETGVGGGANADPSATDDAFSVAENGTLTVLPSALLANDGDTDGDTLSLASVGNAVGGTVALDGAGRVVFTPAPDTVGAASFEYTVSDGRGGTDTATVDVTVVDAGAGETVTEIDFALSDISSYDRQDTRPGAGAAVGDGGASLSLDGNVWKTVDIGDYQVSEDSVLRFDFRVDELGESHAIGLDDDSDFTNGAAIFQLAGPQTLKLGDQTYAGTYTGVGDTVSYEIDLSAFAGQTFDRLVLVNDEDGGDRDAASTFSDVRLVDGLPDGGTGAAPFIDGGAIADITVAEDGLLEQNLPILDPDSGFTVTYAGLPDFVTADGTLLSGAPDGGDVGTYTVTVTATDPDLNSVTDTFDITVTETNDAPVAAADALPPLAAVLDSSLAIALPDGFFTDEDAGDTLTYELVGPSAGLVIDPVTGTITGAPDTAGEVVLTVRATDGGGLFDEATLTLDVSDGPPREGVLIEAEDFTGFGAPGSGFVRETVGNASGDAVVRLAPNSQGEIATDLAAGGVTPGLYDLAITYYDETDGEGELTVLIDDGSGPVQIASKVFDATGLPGQGSSIQAGNRQVLTIEAVDVAPGATLILRGVADGDLVRIDKVELEPVDNAAPVLAAEAQVAVAENETEVATIAATDPEAKPLSYAIEGGADAAAFEIDAATGALSFAAAPDFEAPAAAGGGNAYEVVVSASDGALVTEQTLTVDVTNANEAPVPAAPAALRIDLGAPATLPALSSLFADPDAGDTATYTVDALPAGLSLDADGVTLVGTPEAAGTTTVTVTATDAAGLASTATLEITVAEPGAFDPADYAPGGDLDGDTILNAVDDDVDGDLTPNADDPFAYDAADGMTLAAGETATYDFDIEGSIYENGMTGFLQGTANGGDFEEDTGAATVDGGALVVDPVTAGDTGSLDTPEDDAVVGVKNGSFAATAVVANPWAGAAPNPNSFDQLGLVVGLDSDDMIKLVFGQSSGVVEFQLQEGGAATKFGGADANANVPLPAGLGLDDFAAAEITLDVVSLGAGAAEITGGITFLDAAGGTVGSLDLPTAPVGGALAAALADADEGVAVGFTHVDGGGAPSFVARMESLTITAAGGGAVAEDEVVYRINAGGALVEATDGGPDWTADGIGAPADNPYFSAIDDRGDTQGYAGAASAIPEGVPAAVLDTARSSDGAFSYDIPVSELGGNGNYEVRLHVAELFTGGHAGGFRNFDATIEGAVPAAWNDIDPGTLFGADAGVLAAQVAVTDGVLNLGFVQDVVENPIVNAIEVVALGGDIVGPPDPTGPDEALAILNAAKGVDTGGDYATDATGAARLEVIAGATDVQTSNFGAGSFQLVNTGDKDIAAVFLDFRDALYRDSVIDFDGSAGDTSARPFEIDSGAGDTGAITGPGGVLDIGASYFLQGEDPLPNTTTSGKDSAGGYRGLLLRFDGSDGGFSSGETIGFAGDMDPNSVAGLGKGDIDGGSIGGDRGQWDVGGISGAELIGSSFTVLFDDGTSATGHLGTDGGVAGSIGTAVEGRAAKTASVTVNGATSDGIASYGGTEPVITVSGAVGDEVVVTMTKGLNPVTNNGDGGVADLVAARLADARPEFQVNNAADFQSVTVTIGQDGTATVPAGAFNYSDASPNGQDYGAGSAYTNGFDTAPIAVAAAVVGPDDLPLGPVDRVYAVSNGTPVGDGGGGGGGAPVEGYFEIIGSGSNARFKAQFEDANVANGGTDPGGAWTYFDGPDSDGEQAGFQGSGYYLFGDADSPANNSSPPADSVLDFQIFVPEGEEGVYSLRVRASRDTTPGIAGDKRNDVWVRIDDDAEALQVTDINSVSSQGFVKLFGAGSNGNWGFGGNIDSVSEEEPNFKASFELDAGLHTISFAGRSQGYHADSWDLWKGTSGGPSGSSDSAFVEGPPDLGGGGGSGGDLVIGIDSSSDDWEERGAGGSGDFEIGENGGPQWAALRFDGIDVPDGAEIERAFIRFEADGDHAGAAAFTIAVEADETAAPYSAANLPDGRTYASDEFLWSDVEDWEDGESYDTPDISALIEAAIGADGVEDGALGFFFEGSGKRGAVSFDGDGAAPQLHIEFADEVL